MDARPLTAKQARAATDEAKQSAVDLWLKLYELHERGAHTALGHDSWHAYCEVEFGMARETARGLLNAGRVVALLEDRPQMRSIPVESQARELARLLPKGSRAGPPEPPTGEQVEAVREVWTRAVETHDGKPTAADVRAEVERVKPSRPKRQRQAVTPERVAREYRERFTEHVRTADTHLRLAEAMVGDDRLATVTDNEAAEWMTLLSRIRERAEALFKAGIEEER